MNAYLPYVWLGVAVIFGILGSFRRLGLIAVPGAVGAALLAFFDVRPLFQIILFVALAFACGFLFRVLFSGGAKGSADAGDAPGSLIGQEGEVILQIDNPAGLGLVRVAGQEWAARALAFDGLIESGTRVSVVAVEGVRLICRPL